ncbi:hypothetical protein SAMN06265348_103268 [Pedobacter westerhofensis]|uniref:Uncharacterized protein n=1 Tax=Pedobacter westerhofensis TaxID=425512 RepID=A0A521C890_9SPHI|nr:hypothetical protein [Pedobacter westerhofensis]SMO55021.1 hypothetical protein SAMN06265348_103268 [Pedobacter westerhofensis]
MKKSILFLAIAISLRASSQQLTSAINNANGDNSNILIANQSAVSVTNDNRATIWLDNDGKLKFRAVTGKGFGFRNYANTEDQVVIDGAGNVGIGTLVPIGRLNVNVPLNGSISAISIGNDDPGNLAVPAGSALGGYNIDFKTWRDIVPFQTGARIRAERINNWMPNNALKQAMDLVFYTSSGDSESSLLEKMRIRSDGAILIGTGSHSAKLNVDGIIHSREVVVDNNIWPDFVFEDKYKTLPLSELERYLAENRHLPEIPSAREVKEKGVNLGDMNSLLLQKIEELTLYVIELKKENAAFKSKTLHLSNKQNIRIQKLEHQLASSQSGLNKTR